MEKMVVLCACMFMLDVLGFNKGVCVDVLICVVDMFMS